MPNDGSTVVLVADDEPSTRALVAGHLRNQGYKVIEASDGDEAWELAHEHLPHLVVLDVMMPGMSGWEVCRKIREAVSLAHTGIVMLTGIGENLNEMTSPLYGADAYVDKPFEFSVLDAKINETLSRRRVGAIGRGDGATELAEPVRQRPETEPSDVPVKSSDVRRAAARKRGLVPKKTAARAPASDPDAESKAPPTKKAGSKKASKAAGVASAAGAKASKAKKKPAAKKATKKTAKKATKKTARNAARKVTKKTARNAAKKTAKKAAKATKKASARKATKKTAKKTARKATKKAPARKARKKAPARKAAKKTPARKAAKKTARKAAKKTARNAAKKAPARKATKKTARNAAKKAPARKATKKRARNA